MNDPRPCNRCAASVIDFPTLDGGTVPLDAEPLSDCYLVSVKGTAWRCEPVHRHHKATCAGRLTPNTPPPSIPKLHNQLTLERERE